MNNSTNLISEQLFCLLSAAMETELLAHVGTTVALPCKLDVNQCGQLHSVKWYKDSNRVYVLSHAGQGRSEEER
ncbi:hypothetical protein NQ314_004688 [Rhamnusium bicolor]|uniref:Immunoglobulin V-set domain-containing protein n=1 Tax=Rhamnusium bicolor TaxID=1586634 RepID=A0AAV8ZKQ4_9CUCU|nr:hypothetical protein NQ314_004688 [Rhamnusium bicolor]